MESDGSANDYDTSMSHVTSDSDSDSDQPMSDQPMSEQGSWYDKGRGGFQDIDLEAEANGGDSDKVNTHLPFFILTEKFPSDLQIHPSDCRRWEFSTVSPNSDGEIRNSDRNFSARFFVRLKKERCN